MKRMIWPAVLVAVVAIAALATLFWRSQRTQAPVVAAPAAPPRDPAKDVVDVTAMMRSAQRGDGPGPAGTDPAGARAEAEKELIASVRRDQALYEKVFNSETAGPEARRLESVLQRAMSEPGVRAARHLPQSTRVECKNTQCRITALFAPSQDPSEWATRLAIAAASDFASNRQVGSEEPGGEVSRVLYFYPQPVDPRLRDPVRGITR